ncbi:MAG: low molecular weight protein arginine phosphatase [Syntrophomonadaceae bacterium]|jgi:protein-tyrosine-phosphatase
MKNILLVCSGNTCRSPMAAALLDKILQERGLNPQEYRIASAGLAAAPGWPASPEAIHAMQLEGLDISGHRSQTLNQNMVEEADVVLTMTASHRRCILDQCMQQGDKVYTLAEFAEDREADILDPFGMDEVKYIESAAEIKRLLDKIVDKMIGEQ